jgi:hypothetical protein
MTNRLEDRIRDYLADHLELIEKGLRFVAKEYALSSSVGAGGRIDLLARDVFGHVVVIEIKRSDKTARQALNEIHKYTALFRISQGLDEARIRLIVVSTEWHELILPLSEFAETTDYPVEGMLITALSNGVVEDISKVTLLKKGCALKISRAQCVYLYENAARRDRQFNRLVAAVKGAGVEDFAILRCDYSGKNPRVVYAHANYLCFASPLPDLTGAEAERLKARIEWDDNLNEPDENFIVHINTAMLDFYDSLEIGYPEKLTAIRADWSTSVSARAGRLSRDQSVLTDEEIIAMAQAVEGGSHFYLGKISSPRFEASWTRLRADLDLVLRGNRRFQEVVPRFIDEVKADAPTATVSVSIYNPCNLFLTLYWIAWTQDYSRCPQLEIVVEDRVKGWVKVLIGFLAWDGQDIQATPEEIANRVYGDDSGWLLAVTLHETFEDEDSAVTAHHLRVITVEWLFEKDREIGPTEVHVEDKSLCRRPFNEERQRPMTHFSAAHAEYLGALKTYLENRCTGLPGNLTATRVSPDAGELA